MTCVVVDVDEASSRKERALDYLFCTQSVAICTKYRNNKQPTAHLLSLGIDLLPTLSNLGRFGRCSLTLAPLAPNSSNFGGRHTRLFGSCRRLFGGSRRHFRGSRLKRRIGGNNQRRSQTTTGIRCRRFSKRYTKYRLCRSIVWLTFDPYAPGLVV